MTSWVDAPRRVDNLRLLLDAGADPNVGIDRAIERADEAIVRMLIDAGAAPGNAGGRANVRPR